MNKSNKITKITFNLTHSDFYAISTRFGISKAKLAAILHQCQRADLLKKEIVRASGNTSFQQRSNLIEYEDLLSSKLDVEGNTWKRAETKTLERSSSLVGTVTDRSFLVESLANFSIDSKPKKLKGTQDNKVEEKVRLYSEDIDYFLAEMGKKKKKQFSVSKSFDKTMKSLSSLIDHFTANSRVKRLIEISKNDNLCETAKWRYAYECVPDGNLPKYLKYLSDKLMNSTERIIECSDPSCTCSLSTSDTKRATPSVNKNKIERQQTANKSLLAEGKQDKIKETVKLTSQTKPNIKEKILDKEVKERMAATQYFKDCQNNPKVADQHKVDQITNLNKRIHSEAKTNQEAVKLIKDVKNAYYTKYQSLVPTPLFRETIQLITKVLVEWQDILDKEKSAIAKQKLEKQTEKEDNNRLEVAKYHRDNAYAQKYCGATSTSIKNPKQKKYCTKPGKTFNNYDCRGKQYTKEHQPQNLGEESDHDLNWD